MLNAFATVDCGACAPDARHRTRPAHAAAEGRRMAGRRASAADRRKRCRGPPRARDCAGVGGGRSACRAAVRRRLRADDTAGRRPHTCRQAADRAHVDGAERGHLRAEHRPQASVCDQGRPARGGGRRGGADAGGVRRGRRRSVGDRVGADRRRRKHIRTGARHPRACAAEPPPILVQWSIGCSVARPDALPETPASGDARLAAFRRPGHWAAARRDSRAPNARRAGSATTCMWSASPITGEARETAVGTCAPSCRRGTSVAAAQSA